MKILKLKLNHFGAFPERGIELQQSSSVLVYGANESGKSTLLRGMRESIFGITKTSLHLGSEVRTEVELMLQNGQKIRVTRTRAPKKTTLDVREIGSEASLSEEEWHHILSGMDLDTYSSLFGFGLSELAAGEHSLKGINLTEALLGSGQAESVDWRKVRNEILNEKNGLLTLRGRTQKIPMLLKSLRSLQSEADAKMVRPRMLRDLREEQEWIESKRSQLQSDRNRWAIQLRSCERAIEAWPVAQQYRALREELNQLKFQEEMTAESAAEWIQIQDAIRIIEEELKTMQFELNSVLNQLTSIPDDRSMASRLESLERLTNFIPSLQESIERVQILDGELRTLRRQKEVLQESLGESQNFHGRLPPSIDISTKSRLFEILEPIQSLAVQIDLLQSDRSRIESQKELYRQKCNDHIPFEMSFDASAKFESLSRWIGQWRLAKEASGQAVELRLQVESMRRQLEGKWGLGQTDCASALGILPSNEEIDFTIENQREWHHQWTSCTQNLHHLELELQDVEKLLSDIDEGGELPSRDELTRLRGIRDRLLDNWILYDEKEETPFPLFQEAVQDPTQAEPQWQSSESAPAVTSRKQRLTGKSGTRKAANSKMLVDVHRQLDAWVDRMVRDSQRFARREQGMNQKRQLEERRSILKTQQEELHAHLIQLENEANQIGRKLSCSSMNVQSLRQLRILLEKLQPLETRLGAIEQREWQAADRVRSGILDFFASIQGDPSAMQFLGDDLEASWEFVQQRWQSIQKSRGQLEQLRDSILSLEHESRSIEARLAEAHQLLQHHEVDLQNWLATLGLPPSTSPKTAEKLVHAVSDLKQLDSELGRVEIEREQHVGRLREFRDAIGNGLHWSPESVESRSWTELFQELEEAKSRASEAASDQRRREALLVRSEERSSQVELRKLQWIDWVSKRKKIAERLPSKEFDQIDKIAQNAHLYWERIRHCESLRQQLALLTAVVEDLDRWIDELSQRTLESIEIEREELRLQLEKSDHEIQEMAKQLGSSEQKLRMLREEDPVAELVTERQSLLATLEEATEKWIVLSIADLLLEKALQGFHQQQELAIRSTCIDLFRQLTNNEYLDVRPATKDASRFIVLNRDGQEKLPEQLSTGTREQLYLAIRLAHIRHYCEQNEPLPLILDDCFVNFDDARLLSTLEAIQNQSNHQQVILLSCHGRTRDAFQEVAPHSNILTLGPV